MTEPVTSHLPPSSRPPPLSVPLGKLLPPSTPCCPCPAFVSFPLKSPALRQSGNAAHLRSTSLSLSPSKVSCLVWYPKDHTDFLNSLVPAVQPKEEERNKDNKENFAAWADRPPGLAAAPAAVEPLRDASQDQVSVTLTMSSQAAEDIGGVLIAIADLLKIAVPPTFEVSRSPSPPDVLSLGRNNAGARRK